MGWWLWLPGSKTQRQRGQRACGEAAAAAEVKDASGACRRAWTRTAWWYTARAWRRRGRGARLRPLCFVLVTTADGKIFALAVVVPTSVLRHPLRGRARGMRLALAVVVRARRHSFPFVVLADRVGLANAVIVRPGSNGFELRSRADHVRHAHAIIVLARADGLPLGGRTGGERLAHTVGGQCARELLVLRVPSLFGHAFAICHRFSRLTLRAHSVWSWQQ